MSKKVNIKNIDGGICAPNGYSAAGVSCGIKKSNKKDVALVFSLFPCTSAGVFTKNIVKAAPVLLSQKHINLKNIQAIVLNSGNANACTGKQGLADANEMALQSALALRLKKEEVLVASTGIIGVPMPMKKVISGIWAASRMIKKDGSSAAEAIMTTDITKKEIAIEIDLGKKGKIRIGAMAKGSGMIAPHMATMLSVITTDAAVSKSVLKKVLTQCVDETFNMITVDNDMSTNDCLFLLANGCGPQISGEDIKAFSDGILYVCKYLAKEIAKDGEGATKLITVNVRGANSISDARSVAKTIAGSSLLKCAIYGTDPNFGRIMAAAGYSGAKFNPDKVDVFIDKTQLVKKGTSLHFDAHHASGLLKKNEVSLTIHLNNGKFEATAWGCDMTEGYITINAKYHT